MDTTFEEWFDSLPLEEQREYIQEQEVNSWVDYYKDFVVEF